MIRAFVTRRLGVCLQFELSLGARAQRRRCFIDAGAYASSPTGMPVSAPSKHRVCSLPVSAPSSSSAVCQSAQPTVGKGEPHD